MSARDAMGSVARRMLPGWAETPARSASRGPALRPVPLPPATAPRAPFVALVVVLLAAGLVGLVLLSTSLQHGAFEINDLERSTAELRDRKETLAQRVAYQESPEVLASRAKDLGMVPSPRRAFLRLPDGAVIGEPPDGAGE